MRKMLFVLFAGIIFWGCLKNDDGTITALPVPPIDLIGNAVSTTQVNLSWTDKSTNEDGFKIQRQTGTGNFADIGNTGKDVTNYGDNGLIPGITYTYRVYAYNSAGASLTYTNEVIVTTGANIGLPTLATSAITNITQTTATSGGVITNDGGSPVTARGVVWSLSANPTFALATKTIDGTGAGTFTSNMTGLAANSTYYVRAYATNSTGTSYGNQLSFTTSQIPVNPVTVTDASGNTYPTVTIGTQVWMAENLRTTKYRDGSDIPIVTSRDQWFLNFNNGNPLGEPMMGWFNNDQATYTANKFGALYNWYAITPSSNGNKNVCPTGWHVSTDAEWTTLTSFLGGEYEAGAKMKTDPLYWPSSNTDVTNSSGWSGLPGGYRNNGGDDNYNGVGYWWTSTSASTNEAMMRALGVNGGGVVKGNTNKTFGFSVRCVRN